MQRKLTAAGAAHMYLHTSVSAKMFRFRWLPLVGRTSEAVAEEEELTCRSLCSLDQARLRLGGRGGRRIRGRRCCRQQRRQWLTRARWRETRRLQAKRGQIWRLMICKGFWVLFVRCFGCCAWDWQRSYNAYLDRRGHSRRRMRAAAQWKCRNQIVRRAGGCSRRGCTQR
jgi:hypothetical protein